MGFIDKPQQVWWRKIIFQVHLWVGILLASYVFVISISGTVLIFREDLTNDAPRISVRRPGTTSVPWGDMVAVAQKLHPDYRVSFITDESSQGRALRIFLTKDRSAASGASLGRDVYFDPITGGLLGDQDFNYNKRHPFYSFVGNLHINLLMGPTGRKINSICAAFLLLLCATGIVVWWPGRLNWKQGLNVKRKTTWKRANYDSHRAIGFWSLLVVAMWASTGVYFGYSRSINTVLTKVLPFSASASHIHPTWKPGDQILPINTLYMKVHTYEPYKRIVRVAFPQKAGDSIHVLLTSDRFPHYLRNEAVLLDPKTGHVISTQDQWKMSKAGDLLLTSLTTLHFVRFQSVSVRILFALLGLSPILLALTGLLMWWNRVLRKRWQLLRSRPTRGQLQPAPECVLIAHATDNIHAPEYAHSEIFADTHH